MSYLTKILALLASLGPKIPQAVKLLNDLWELFADDIAKTIGQPGNELQLTELSADEQKHLDTISAALSASGTQAAFDLQRFRELAAWAAKSEIGKIVLSSILTLLTKALAG